MTLRIEGVQIFVDGREVSALTPDTQAQVVVLLRNTSNHVIRKVLAIIESADGEVAFSPRSVFVGDIPARSVGRAVWPRMSWSGEQGCDPTTPPSFVLDFHPHQPSLPGFRLPTLCQGLHFAESGIQFSGGDHDFLPERGEEVEIWVSVWNTGTESVSVGATLSIDSLGITVIKAEGYFGQMEPKTESRIREPFVVKIAEDAPLRQGPCWGLGGPPPTLQHPSFAAEMQGTMLIRAKDLAEKQELGTVTLPFYNTTFCQYVDDSPAPAEVATGTRHEPVSVPVTLEVLAVAAIVTAAGLWLSRRKESPPRSP